MKVVAFNGSPRLAGSTAESLNIVLANLERHGIQGELIQVGGRPLRGCTACYACWKGQTGYCVFDDDPVNGWIDKIKEADGVILGSPVYFLNVTAEMKAFIDRVGFIARNNGRMFARKAGAAVVVQRRHGAFPTLDALMHFFVGMQMYIVGGANNVMAMEPGEMGADAEGLGYLQSLADNLALLLKMMENYRVSGK